MASSDPNSTPPTMLDKLRLLDLKAREGIIPAPGGQGEYGQGRYIPSQPTTQGMDNPVPPADRYPK